MESPITIVKSKLQGFFTLRSKIGFQKMMCFKINFIKIGNIILQPTFLNLSFHAWAMLTLMPTAEA